MAPGGDARAHLDALTRHLEKHVPWGAHVTVTPGDIGQPYAIDATGPVYDAARAAFRQAWGNEPVDMGMGGSIPFIAEFADAFPSAKILVTGVEDPGTQAHSINESLDIGVLERAALLKTRKAGDPHPFVDPVTWTERAKAAQQSAATTLASERAKASAAK